MGGWVILLSRDMDYSNAEGIAERSELSPVKLMEIEYMTPEIGTMNMQAPSPVTMDIDANPDSTLNKVKEVVIIRFIAELYS